MAAIQLETVEGDDEALPPPHTSTPDNFAARRSPIELFAAAVALLIPIAFIPSGLEAGEWSLRAAILLVVLGVGLPMLLSQARGPRPLAARSAVAFLAIGLASAISSHNHTTAFFGLYEQANGLLYMASLAAAWAIGRNIRQEARPLVEMALILGILVNVGIALLGSLGDLSSLGASVVDSAGRASALAGNPVHLGALTVLGLALLVPRLRAAPATWSIPVVATVAAAQLSGTRVALAVIAAIVLWAGRRHGVRFGVGVALLVLLGLGAGSAIGHGSATGRASGLQESWVVRPETWLSARHSLAQRPLLGVGPGQFMTATSPYRPIAVGRLEGPEKLFTDAHNLFVEYATTTGMLGVGALILWLIAASRQARGCLLAGALAVLAVHLFEPQSVVTTPLAFLALGAGGSYDGVRLPRHRRAVDWIIPTCCVVAAIAMAAVLLVGEFQLGQSQLDLTLAPASEANRILPAWPRTAAMLAQVWLFEGITGHDPAGLQRSRTWLRLAVSRSDTDPALWNGLAELDESNGLTRDAMVEYLTALHFNPTSIGAMDGLARLARDRCDLDQERYWTQRSLHVLPPPPLSAIVGRKAVPPAASCGGGRHA